MAQHRTQRQASLTAKAIAGAILAGGLLLAGPAAIAAAALSGGGGGGGGGVVIVCISNCGPGNSGNTPGVDKGEKKGWDNPKNPHFTG